MKNLKLLTVVFFLLSAQSVFSQSISDWMDFLDAYCEEYFEDCFDWDYIDIDGITDIDNLSDSHIVITGNVRNTGYFGAEVTREFKADIRIYSNRVTVNFKKQGSTAVQGTYWNDCENTIYN